MEREKKSIVFSEKEGKELRKKIRSMALNNFFLKISFHSVELFRNLPKKKTQELKELTV